MQRIVPALKKIMFFKLGDEVIETMIRQNIIGRVTNCKVRMYKEPKGAKSVCVKLVYLVTFTTHPTTQPKTRARILIIFDFFSELLMLQHGVIFL